MGTRNIYSIPTDVRPELDQLIEQCSAENGGLVVGNPSVTFSVGSTRLEVDDHVWWKEIMRVRYSQLVLIGVNRMTQGKNLESDAT